MSKGICVAGNMLVDILYPVEKWPKRGELAHVRRDIGRSVGGGACNVIVDLAKLDSRLPLFASGRVGDDAEGQLILDTFARYPNIDISGVIRGGISAFSMVMNDLDSGERTFFTCLGVNEDYCEDDIDWDALDCDILYVGYILALKALDQVDERYGSKLARLFNSAHEHGIKTAVDVVSESSDRFRLIVPAALKYTDYCVINENEAEQSTGVRLRDANGCLLRENMPGALRTMREMGVSTWAVIHSPEGGFGMDADGNYVEKDSLKLPEGYIRGTVGAGDAFCAGVLYGAEKGFSLEKAVELGIAGSACCLGEASATDGMRAYDETMALYRKLR